MPDLAPSPKPGLIVLFGSGETSPSGRKIFDTILRQLPHSPLVAMLETPAGFELNSERVIGKIGEFIEHRLQNYAPRIKIIPARKKGTEYSPEDEEINEPILNADLIFLGPGSPSYAVRQLKDTIAWHYCLARFSQGASFVLASAATIAISAYCLPVYEIYKVGEELHWIEGLNLFGMANVPLVFIPHWNNHDGGSELDTSHCFMGKSRFCKLLDLLPDEITLVGIDEKTALVIDLHKGLVKVLGLGGVTLVKINPTSIPEYLFGKDNKSIKHEYSIEREGMIYHFVSGEEIALSSLGNFDLGLQEIRISDKFVKVASNKEASSRKSEDKFEYPPNIILELVSQREQARQNNDWVSADHMREKLSDLGWMVVDTPRGPKIFKNQ